MACRIPAPSLRPEGVDRCEQAQVKSDHVHTINHSSKNIAENWSITSRIFAWHVPIVFAVQLI